MSPYNYNLLFSLSVMFKIRKENVFLFSVSVPWIDISMSRAYRAGSPAYPGYGMIPLPTEFEVPVYGVLTECPGCKAEVGWHEVEVHFFFLITTCKLFCNGWFGPYFSLCCVWGLDHSYQNLAKFALSNHLSSLNSSHCSHNCLQAVILLAENMLSECWSFKENEWGDLGRHLHHPHLTQAPH